MFAQNNPIVRLCIPMLLGMLTADFCLERWACGGLVLPLCLMCACTVVMWASHRSIGVKQPRQLRTTFGVATMLLCAVVGWTLLTVQFERRERALPASMSGPLRGRVTSVQAKPKTLGVEVETEGGACVQLYLAASVDAASPALQLGDSIEASARHLRPTSPRLRRLHPDADEAEWGAYRDYLYYRGVVATGYVARSDWRITRRGQASGWSHWRARLLAAYADSGLDEATEALLAAMTLGDKSALQRQQRSQFAAAGLSHLLALSGFHLVLMLSIFNVLTARGWLSRRWRHLSVVVVIPLLWAYAALTGLSPSLVRAVVMCSMFQLAWALGREESFPNTCALAVVAMLIAEPMWIRSIGFQLSFLSVVGIYVVARPIVRRMAVRRWCIQFVVNTLALTFAATLFTLPLVAFYFGCVPLWSLLTNLAAALLSMAFMWLAAAWWIFFPLPLLHNAIGAALSFVARSLNAVAASVAGWPLSTLDYRPSLPEVFLLYAVIFSLLTYIRRRTARPLQLALLAIIVMLTLRIAAALS